MALPWPREERRTGELRLGQREVKVRRAKSNFILGPKEVRGSALELHPTARMEFGRRGSSSFMEEDPRAGEQHGCTESSWLPPKVAMCLGLTRKIVGTGTNVNHARMGASPGIDM